MKKNLTRLVLLFSSITTYSQIGVNTATPNATLDVRSSANDLSKTDGIIVPKLTGDQLKLKDSLYGTDQIGTIIYATTAVLSPTVKTAAVTSQGFYYFDGNKWVKIQAGIPTGDPTPDAFIDDPTNAMVKLGASSSGNTRATGADFVVKDNGNTGIGTSSPSQKLDVNGIAKADKVAIGANYTSAALYVKNNIAAEPILGLASSDNIYRMYVQDGGNVGIGTSSPSQKLDVNGIAKADKVAVGANYTSAALYVKNNIAAEPILGLASSDNIYRMYVQDGGNVGINTNSPSQKLDVDGNIRLRNVPGATNLQPTDRIMILSDDGTGKKVNVSTLKSDIDTNIYNTNGTLTSDRTVNLDGKNMFFEGPSSTIGIRSKNSSPSEIYLHMDNNGTNLPTNQIVGKINFSGKVGGSNKYLAGIRATYVGNGSNTLADLRFSVNDADNQNMVLSSEGRLGIGTGSPLQKLDVMGNARISEKLAVGSNWTGAGLSVVNSVASEPILVLSNASNTKQLTVQNNGNVGIGVSAPDERLDINGTAKLRNVPNGDSDDKILVIANDGTVKKKGLDLPPSPSFALYASSNSYVWRNADNVHRELNLNVTNKIYSAYIERIDSNKFRVKKNGIYSIEVWGMFANVPYSSAPGSGRGCSIQLTVAGNGFQQIGDRWSEGAATANFTKTVILNQGQVISTESICVREGNQRYQTAPGSSIFVTYMPL
ncbi:hypothetical protein C8D70_1085 [Chryseobacterium sp. CBTAP 102]|uniref:hypothetical protein n=1 Tax=Chryseobacterium sp. CBTAP 102 TaxID=2135644 RepID=UPI000D7614F0|nr:hypothetical protein [Chryseobacterium sp. CBTAP 102]PXW13602.1 hypothetical protein C8D70_1085 [Chryseobacterium sp. CBTAP 102]